MQKDQIWPTAKRPGVDDSTGLSDLQKASDALKAKIAEARDRNDEPVDSALGNPKWEKNAADGHLDRPDDEDE